MPECQKDFRWLIIIPTDYCILQSSSEKCLSSFRRWRLMQRPRTDLGAEKMRLWNAQTLTGCLYHTSPSQAQGSLQDRRWEDWKSQSRWITAVSFRNSRTIACMSSEYLWQHVTACTGLVQSQSEERRRAWSPALAKELLTTDRLWEVCLPADQLPSSARPDTQEYMIFDVSQKDTKLDM